MTETSPELFFLTEEERKERVLDSFARWMGHFARGEWGVTYVWEGNACSKAFVFD